LRAIYYLAPIREALFEVFSRLDTGGRNLDDARVAARHVDGMVDALETLRCSYDAMTDELGVTDEVVDLARRLIPVVDRMHDLYRHIVYADETPKFLAQMDAAGCIAYPGDDDAPTCPTCGPGATECQLNQVFPGPSDEVRSYEEARTEAAGIELFRRALHRVRRDGE
jgi:hypothetical protein